MFIRQNGVFYAGNTKKPPIKFLQAIAAYNISIAYSAIQVYNKHRRDYDELRK